MNWVSKAILSTFAIVLTLLFTSCSSQRNKNFDPILTSINIVDRNGMSEIISAEDRLQQYEGVNFLEPQSFQKVLRIYSRDPSGNIPAYVTSYHPNGYPHKYLEIVNGRASGVYLEWYPNGVKKIEAHVIEGMGDISSGVESSWVFDGCSKVWKPCGELEATIPYVKGKLEGVATYYHGNGNLWKIIPYTDNKISGRFEIYKEDDSLLLSANYVAGEKEGELIRYWEPEVVAAEEFYSNGLLVNGSYYSKKGKLIASVTEGNGIKAIFGDEEIIQLSEYRHGMLEGEIKCIDCYGRVYKIYHVKDKAKHGEEVTFYEAPRLQKTLSPKLLVNWYHGKIQGTCKSWYDTGTLESQREMSNNKKNGHTTAWYRDGTLMMIEEYEQDKLIRGEYFSKKDKDPISHVKEGRGTATLYDSEGNFIQKINYAQGKPIVEN